MRLLITGITILLGLGGFSPALSFDLNSSQIVIDDEFLRLDFRDPVRSSATNTSGAIRLYDPAGTESFTLPIPWNDLSPADDPEIIIALNLNATPALRTWLEQFGEVWVEVGADIFFSDLNPGQGNFPVTDFHVDVFQSNPGPGGGGGPGVSTELRLHWAEFREQESLLSLYFSDPIVDSLINRSGLIGITSEDNSSIVLSVPWDEVSPAPDDHEIWVWVPPGQRAVMSSWPDYPFGMTLALDSNVFTGWNNQGGNLPETDFYIDHMDAIRLDMAAYDAAAYKIQLEFNQDVDTLNMDGDRELILFHGPTGQEITVPPPLAFSVPDPGDLRKIDITLPAAVGAVVNNWPDYKRTLHMDLEDGAFKGTNGSKTGPYSWWPVLGTGILAPVHTEYYFPENKIKVEFNAPVDKSLTDKTGTITLHSMDGRDSLTLTSPWEEISPPEFDREIWIRMTDAQADILEQWPQVEGGFEITLPANTVFSDTSTANEKEDRLYVNYFMGGPGGGPTGLQLFEIAFDPASRLLSFRFSGPVEQSLTPASASVTIYSSSNLSNSLHIQAPFIFQGEDNNPVVKIELSPTQADFITALKDAGNELFLDMAGNSFKQTGMESWNPPFSFFPVNYGYVIENMGGFPPIAGLRFYYHEADDVLRIESDRNFDDAYHNFSGQIALRVLGPNNFAAILPQPWQDRSPFTNDQEILIVLDSAQAEDLEREMTPGVDLVITVDANTFAHGPQDGNPVIQVQDTARVFFLPGDPEFEQPYVIPSHYGHISSPDLLIEIDPRVFHLRLTEGIDTAAQAWINNVMPFPYSLPDVEGPHRLFLQFQDSLGNASPWMEETLLLDNTAPVLTFFTDSLFVKNDSDLIVRGELIDNLSGAFQLFVYFVREADGFVFDGKDWLNNTDTGAVAANEQWEMRVPSTLMEPGNYSLHLAGMDSALNTSAWQTQTFRTVDPDGPPELVSIQNLDTAGQIWQEDASYDFTLVLKTPVPNDSVMWVAASGIISLSGTSDSGGHFTFHFNVSPLQIDVGTRSDTLSFINGHGQTLVLIIASVVQPVNDPPGALILSTRIEGGAARFLLTGQDEEDSAGALQFTSTLLNMSGAAVPARDSTRAQLAYYPLGDGSYQFITRALDSDGRLQSDSTITQIQVAGISLRTAAPDQWNMIGVLNGETPIDALGADYTLALWQDKSTPRKLINQYLMNDEITRLEAGKGYWLYSPDTVILTVNTNEFVDTAVGITLEKGFTGWNQIANPFPYPVKVETPGVEVFSWVSVTSDLENTLGILQPGGAYWAFTDSDRIIQMAPSPYFADSSGLLKQSPPYRSGWHAQLSASAGAYQDNYNILGMDPELSQPNLSEPPKMGRYISVFFTALGGSAASTTDIRKTTGSGEIWWDLGIIHQGTGAASALITLNQLSENQTPPVYFIQKGNITQFGSGDSLRLATSGGVDYFSLVATDDPDFITRFQAVFNVESNTPNPVRQYTYFPVTLPQRWGPNGLRLNSVYDVGFEVYSLDGKRISTWSEKGLPQGHHLLKWLPINGSGKKIAAGTYIVRIRAGNFTASRSMTIVR